MLGKLINFWMKTHRMQYRYYSSMEDHNRIVDSNYHNYPIYKFIIGLVCLAYGIPNILLSLNMIQYVDTRSNQLEIFNDPHSWQAFAWGMTLVLFGATNIRPARMELLGKINNYLLLIFFLAFIIGIILQKIERL
jgi:hypothetical protein